MDSDNEQVEQASTTVIVGTKVKKERTEAQKQATAKALEALAKARDDKRKAKEGATTTTVKKTIKTTVKPKSSLPTSIKVVEQEPEPISLPLAPRRQPPKETPSIKDELEAFKHEMRGMLLATAPKKKKKTIIVEDSESSDDEPVVVKKKTTKKTEAPTAPAPADNSEMLRSIFYRNY